MNKQKVLRQVTGRFALVPGRTVASALVRSRERLLPFHRFDTSPRIQSMIVYTCLVFCSAVVKDWNGEWWVTHVLICMWMYIGFMKEYDKIKANCGRKLWPGEPFWSRMKMCKGPHAPELYENCMRVYEALHETLKKHGLSSLSSHIELICVLLCQGALVARLLLSCKACEWHHLSMEQTAWNSTRLNGRACITIRAPMFIRVANSPDCINTFP